MNRARLVALAVALAAVATAIAILVTRSKGSEAPAADAGPPVVGLVPDYVHRPFTSMCTATCDLSTREGIFDAFKQATHKEEVPNEKLCTFVSPRFPRTAPIGHMTAEKQCERLGVMYGCCWTDDPRAAAHDALVLQGWEDADLRKRTEMAANWVAVGFFPMSGTQVIRDAQLIFEAKMELKRALPDAEVDGRLLPDGGVRLRLWVHARGLDPLNRPISDYTRWEYVFGPDGSFGGEKAIEHLTPPTAGAPR